MKVRIYSDIHLDHYSQDCMWYPPALPDDKETTLILAGDIWIGTRWIFHGENSWIEKVAHNFKQVIIVLGNHDYWPCKQPLAIVGGANKCNGMLQDHGIFNVKVLDMGTFADGDYLFVGATLWTDMYKADPLAMYQMSKYMTKDGKCAYETGPNGQWSRFTSERWVGTHYKHRDYIKKVVEQNRDKKIIVVSHHLPLMTLGDPEFLGHISNAFYMSDLSDLILDNSHIVLWCYGHTHYHCDTMLGSTRLINNCVGYRFQCYEQLGLVTHGVIEI